MKVLLITFVLMFGQAYAKDLTGSWYSPDHEGSGFLIDDTPQVTLVYWFSYHPDSNQDQIWFFAQDNPEAEGLALYLPKGQWMSPQFEIGAPVGYLSVTSTGPNTASLSWRFSDWRTCRPIMFSPTWEWCGGKMNIVRLTRRDPLSHER